MRKLIYLLGLSAILPITSCVEKGCTDPNAFNYDVSATRDDGSCYYENNNIKSGEILSDETWTSDKIYYLQGRVIVMNGVTLNIEPGTIIKGKQMLLH